MTHCTPILTKCQKRILKKDAEKNKTFFQWKYVFSIKICIALW